MTDMRSDAYQAGRRRARELKRAGRAAFACQEAMARGFHEHENQCLFVDGFLDELRQTRPEAMEMSR